MMQDRVGTPSATMRSAISSRWNDGANLTTRQARHVAHDRIGEKELPA